MTTTTATTSTAAVGRSSDFPFPPHYSYPPFFTLQPNLTTRASQMHSWSLLIQAYCRHQRAFSLSLIDAVNSPLFHNRTLNRRLTLRDARTVVSWMVSEEGGQRAEWIDKTSSSGGVAAVTSTVGAVVGVGGGSGGAGSGDEAGRFWVYWRRPEEWANVIENWVDETGQKGTVLTLYEIAEGDGTLKEGSCFCYFFSLLYNDFFARAIIPPLVSVYRSSKDYRSDTNRLVSC